MVLRRVAKEQEKTVAEEVPWPNTESNVDMAKPPTFNREVGKVSYFLIAYRLYIRMRIREAIVEEQVQWVLSYIQKESADIWKENIIEDLERQLLNYKAVGEFSADLKKEFREKDDEIVKIAELKKVE